MSPVEVQVMARGEVSDRARELAREELSGIDGVVKGPILGVRVVLTREPNPRIPLPARAEAEVELQGRMIRARAAADSIESAVDDVAERLRRQLRRHVERMITRQREPAQPPPGEWSHRSWSPPPPPGFVRPEQERRIVRRKSFAFGPMSTAEAAAALEDLDHDFFLFHDAVSDADALIHWRDDGKLVLIEPPSARVGGHVGVIVEHSRYSNPIELDAAVAEMNAVGHRFLFFENAATGRGNVIYRRYDGHYGLIEPSG